MDTIKTLNELEKNEMLKALIVTNGNINLSAKLLGIGRATFYRKIKKYNLSITK